MGRFTYQSTVKADFEDRLLAHLQSVIMAKVRRGESFTFTWKDDMSTGGGRTTVYIHPHASMVFKYSGGRSPQHQPVLVARLEPRRQFRPRPLRRHRIRPGARSRGSGKADGLHRGAGY